MNSHQPDFTLELVYDSITELPSFPKVVQKALGMLDDPAVPIAELAETLKYDPGITANILKFANSAYFGLSQQVTSLETALALLGQRQIREILLASASLPYLARPLAGYMMEPVDLWAHSICCALTVDVLSRHVGFKAADSLFIAALLHDIGKIAMHIHVGARLDEIRAIALQEEITFTEAEWRVVGGDHAVIGSQLLRYWEFPHEIVRAVRNHHDPNLYVQDDLSALLALGNVITVKLGVGLGVDAFRHVIHPELLKRCGLRRKDLVLCMGRSLAAMDKAEDILRLAET